MTETHRRRANTDQSQGGEGRFHVRRFVSALAHAWFVPATPYATVGTVRRATAISAATALGLGVGALGCAASTSARSEEGACRSRAQSEYSQCVNPLYFAPGTPHETVHSRDAQACREAYLQALDVCAQLSSPDEVVPELAPLHTRTSSGATTETGTQPKPSKPAFERRETLKGNGD
ncbi:MAG: hypothetical protein IPK13_20625 [Deltaproteobacteria bacterium]|nr:hypothetical protein [Deltaproteobacteria bacterium]